MLPFCHFTPEQWQTIGHEYDEVRDCMLGWDITDYGMGGFDSDVTVHTAGRTDTVPAGTQIRLTPGESIHVQQYLYHDFEVEPGTGCCATSTPRQSEEAICMM